MVGFDVGCLVGCPVGSYVGGGRIVVEHASFVLEHDKDQDPEIYSLHDEHVVAPVILLAYLPPGQQGQGADVPIFAVNVPGEQVVQLFCAAKE